MELADDSFRLFLPVLRSFQVKLAPVDLDGCPVSFCTGIVTAAAGKPTPDQKSAQIFPAGGQGMSAVSAAASCLGEIAERLSLCSQGESDDRVFFSRNSQLEVGLSELAGLSKAQEGCLAGKLGLDYLPGEDPAVNWKALSDRRVMLRSLTGEGDAQCTSLGVLFGEMELVSDRDISLASSSGCAVWRDMDGARQRALLELVERDAVAQGWYNRLGITGIGKAFLAEILPRNLLDFLADRRRVWSLHLVETDLAAWVVMALSYESGGRKCAFGSSAGWNFSSACEGALLELLQAEFSLELMERAHAVPTGNSGDRQTLPRQLVFAREQSIMDHIPLAAASDVDETSFNQIYSYEALLQGCKDRGLRIWEFNATRSDLNIPCVKLLSPDLCNWEPRFGKRRLFDGVVQRGLRSAPAFEAEFAARPFPF